MIKNTFKKTPLFIPFIMAGHPTNEMSLQALIALCDSGSDIIELGVPFSDPIADGPVNQQAAEVGLKNGVTLDTVFDMVKELRRLGYNTPIILFSYLNPILSMRPSIFGHKAESAGVNG